MDLTVSCVQESISKTITAMVDQESDQIPVHCMGTISIEDKENSFCARRKLTEDGLYKSVVVRGRCQVDGQVHTSVIPLPIL